MESLAYLAFMIMSFVLFSGPIAWFLTSEIAHRWFRKNRTTRFLRSYFTFAFVLIDIFICVQLLVGEINFFPLGFIAMVSLSIASYAASQEIAYLTGKKKSEY